MKEDRIAEVLKSERMGHKVPGMRGVYGHLSKGPLTPPISDASFH